MEIDRHRIEESSNKLEMSPMPVTLKIELICIVLIAAIMLFSFVSNKREDNMHNTIAVVHINDTTIKGPIDYYKILSTGVIEIGIGGVSYTTNIENVSLISNMEESTNE